MGSAVIGLDPHLALDAVRGADPGDEDAVGPGGVGHGQRLGHDGAVSHRTRVCQLLSPSLTGRSS